jgi:hypothetical protein
MSHLQLGRGTPGPASPVPEPGPGRRLVGKLLEQVQEDFGEGPGVATYRQGEPVAVTDLGAGPRWIWPAAVVSQAGTGSAGKAWHDRLV